MPYKYENLGKQMGLELERECVLPLMTKGKYVHTSTTRIQKQRTSKLCVMIEEEARCIIDTSDSLIHGTNFFSTSISHVEHPNVLTYANNLIILNIQLFFSYVICR